MWQPIETAPKDKKVLLYSPRHGVVCGCWNECMFFRNPRPYWTHDRESLYGVRAVRDNPPTHWMPLPELPGVQPAPSVPTSLLVAVEDLVTQMEIVSRVGFVDTPNDKDSCAAFCVAEGTWLELMKCVESLAVSLAAAPEVKP